MQKVFAYIYPKITINFYHKCCFLKFESALVFKEDIINKFQYYDRLYKNADNTALNTESPAGKPVRSMC